MEANILKQIFFDHRGHWDAFVKKYGKRIRPNVIKEVEKFRNCGNPKNGDLSYWYVKDAMTFL